MTVDLTKNVETRLKLNSISFRPYQIPIIRAIENDGYKRAVVLMPRRAGKDFLCLQIALRQCLRKVCTIFYIFPTYSNARKAIWDAITIDGTKMLDFFPEQICKKNSSEMKITFINGSIIQFMGSSEYDRLRGTNPYMVIFSEYAYQNPMAFQTIRPILAANNGIAIMISCVASKTLIMSQDGIKRISDISVSRKEYTPFNKNIYGLSGFHNATDFYYGGVVPTLKIRLKSGFEIECSKVHKLWNGEDWIKSTEIKIGDNFPIQYNQNVFGNGLDIDDFKYEKKYSNGFPISISDNNFFYLLGLIHGDGSYDKNKVTITNKRDKSIQKFLISIGFKTYGRDKIHFSYGSKLYVSFLEYLGFKHGAMNKEYPSKLLECNKDQLKEFISGLFDSDGSSNKKRGNIHFASACFQFVKDLQVVLLNFGIVSSIRLQKIKPSALVNISSELMILEASGYFAFRFYEEIGFKLKRKQAHRRFLSDNVKDESGNIYPVDVTKLSFKPIKNLITNPSRMSRRMIKYLAYKYNDKYLKSLLKEYFFFSPVKEIIESESEVFDFVIPETHSFFSNGFISHNTTFGKNHFYDLYQLAKNSDDWFCYRKTVDETMHISDEALSQERAQMSEDMFMQEYYVSFDRGVSGAVFAKIMNELQNNNRLTTVPWERSFPVHTSWDIGYADSTAIIFFQVIGTVVHIIDYYEKNQEGLEHYIKYLDTKPYKYGKHIAPHDMANHSFSTGVSRIEMAANLGIHFIVAPKLPIQDGIEASKVTLAKCYIDKDKCNKLIKNFNLYRYEWDDRRQMYKNTFFHGPESHSVDSFRYLSTMLPKVAYRSSSSELDERYNRVVKGGSTLPHMFR